MTGAPNAIPRQAWMREPIKMYTPSPPAFSLSG